MADEPTLKKTFAEDRDPYATISQFVFHKDYWDCMEHHQDGTPNPEGKKLRKKAKGIMLGKQIAPLIREDYRKRK